MNNYALISDKNIVSDSDNEFELEEQYKELTSEEYKKLFFLWLFAHLGF